MHDNAYTEILHVVKLLFLSSHSNWEKKGFEKEGFRFCPPSNGKQ